MAVLEVEGFLLMRLILVPFPLCYRGTSLIRKRLPRRTPQKPYAQGPMGVLGLWVFSYGRGAPAETLAGFVSLCGSLRLPAARACRSCVHTSTPGPSWGYLKVQFSACLSTFGDNFSQKRPNGSKNVQRITPRRAFCGGEIKPRLLPRAAPVYTQALTM